MKIGFIGLGKMGAGIAENLLRAGHELTVWNRSPGPAQALAAKGAVAADGPEDALTGDILFSMLANDQSIRDVGLDGALLDKAKPGLIHVNMATISVDFALELTDAYARRGLGYVTAVVFGRPEVAAKGELTLVAAGAPESIATLEPLFALISKTSTIVGDTPVKATLFKIAGNFLIASAIEAMGEAFALLRKGGVDPGQFHEVMTNSLFACPLYKNYGGYIVREEFEPAGFALALGRKDVGLALAAAKGLRMSLPLAELVHGHFDEAMAAGLAEKDWSSVAIVIAEKMARPRS